MRDLTDEENDYDYGSNELAELSINHREKYRRIVNSNLDDNDSVERWEQRNLEWAKEMLRK